MKRLALALLWLSICLLFIPSPAARSQDRECKTCETTADGKTTCTPFPCPSEKFTEGDFEKYKGVTSLLARVPRTRGLEDRVHGNPLVLKAASLFLTIADKDDLSEGDMVELFGRLSVPARWEWSPAREIRKVRSGLYLMSLGHAASTQPSSLYLFDGRVRMRIDSGDCGLIHMEEIRATDTSITVRYVRSQGTRPVVATADLVRKGNKWKAVRVEREKEEP